MMTDWYDKTIQALQLNGKGERTLEAYARSVRTLGLVRPNAVQIVGHYYSHQVSTIVR